MARRDEFKTAETDLPALKESFSAGEAKKWLSTILRLTDLTVMLHGAPGVGKSQIVEQISAQEGYELIVCSLVLFDPTELKGIPFVETVVGTGNGSKNTVWAVPDRWPRPAVKYAGDGDCFTLDIPRSWGNGESLSFERKGPEDPWDEICDPRVYRLLKGRPDFVFRKGILFFDEFNVAPSMVQCVTLKLVDSGRIETYELPEEWRIVCAGNLGAADGAFVSKTSSAVNNRFVHFFIEPNHREWISWAKENGIHRGIIGFVQAFPDLLSAVPERGQAAFPTPRMWANLSKLIKAREKELEEEFLGRGDVEAFEELRRKEIALLVRKCGAGFVGLGAAVQLAAFLELFIEMDTERVIAQGDLSCLDLHGLGPDRVFAWIGSSIGFIQAARSLGEDRRDYYRNLSVFLKELPPEYQVAALEMMDEEMLDSLREADEEFYLAVLAHVDGAVEARGASWQ